MRTKQILVTVQFTRQEYVLGARLYLRRSHTVSWIQILAMAIAAVAVGALFRIVGMTLLNTFVAALLLVVAVYGGILYVWKPGHIFDGDSALAQPVRFVFSHEDIARQDAETALLVDWDVEKFWCCREFYFLIPKRGPYLMLPSRVFASEEERRAFEQLVVEANPKAACRHCR